MADEILDKIVIVYEDKRLLVINKPAGLVVTNEGRDKKIETVESWSVARNGNNLARGGIVHRLDKGTSGLLLIAKEKQALDFYKSQFKQRKVVKQYVALVGGNLPQSGNIKVPIGRSKYAFGKFKVMAEGKTAETEFKLNKKIFVNGKYYSWVLINLMTGRTHQIRVHFSYMGWPLVGDTNYGGEVWPGLTRPALHAKQLEIVNIDTSEKMRFIADMPADLKKIYDQKTA